MNFYNRFLALCNSRGKSPSKIVTEMGITKPAVTRWKNGGMPTDATMQKIADYFGTSIEWLLGETDDPTPSLPANIKRELAYALSGTFDDDDDDYDDDDYEGIKKEPTPNWDELKPEDIKGLLERMSRDQLLDVIATATNIAMRKGDEQK